MGAAVALFPELGLSAYSNDDLFHQDALLEATLEALGVLVEASRDLSPVLLVGAPLRFDSALFNCAVAIYRGEILGVTPKTYLPNYREFYEKRQFTAARDAVRREVTLLGRRVPFGNDLIFEAAERPRLRPPRRNLRGRLDAPPAHHLGRPGRGDRAAEPLGVQHHHRQGRLPARTVRLPKRQVRRRVSCTAPPAPAKAPPTSPGTATPSSTRTTRSWPSPSVSRRTSRSSPPTLTWNGSPRNECA